MGRSDRVRRASNCDEYYNARKAKDKKQVALPRGRTSEWIKEASREQVMFKLHAKSPIVHIGHQEIKAKHVGLWKGRCIYDSTFIPHRRD